MNFLRDPLPPEERRSLRKIEVALGAEADGVLPQAIHTAELRVRLPRHHIDMLEYRADQQETTISGVLARELDGTPVPTRRLTHAGKGRR